MSITRPSNAPINNGRDCRADPAPPRTAKIEQLSEHQLLALRYVLAGYESKDIAAVTGRSPHTVDGWLRQCLKVLGVSRREHAARLLAEHEGIGPAQRLISQPLSVAGDGALTQTVQPSGEDGDEPSRFELREPPSIWPLPERDDRISKPPGWRSTRNALSPGQRLGAILLIAVGSMLAFGALLAGLHALSQLVAR